jgi:hypothetical protein
LLLFITLGFAVSGCSVFKTCSNVLRGEEYAASPDGKAVAMIFNASTERNLLKSPSNTNECWYVLDAPTQIEADEDVIGACNAAVLAEGKVDSWTCRIVAQGDNLTEHEQERIAAHQELFGRVRKNDDYGMFKSQHVPHNPDQSTKGL